MAVHEDTEVRRLVLWNRFWCVVLVLVALTWVGRSLLAHIESVSSKGECVWETDGSLRITWLSYNRPRIITHLVYGSDNVAALPAPLVVTDSDQRIRFDRQALDRLTWSNFRTGRVLSPHQGAPVAALYYVPTQARTPEGQP